MSADPSSPLDFLSFAQHRTPDATAEDFLPRALYGEYLEATLLDAEVSAPPHVQFERLCGDVCAIEKIGDGSGYRVRLSDGHTLGADAASRTLDADDVVLALGNPPPAPLPCMEELPRDARPSNSMFPTHGHSAQILPRRNRTAGWKRPDDGGRRYPRPPLLPMNRLSSIQSRVHGLIPPSQTQFFAFRMQG